MNQIEREKSGTGRIRRSIFRVSIPVAIVALGALLWPVSHERLIRFEKNGLVGFITPAGRLAIPARFLLTGDRFDEEGWMPVIEPTTSQNARSDEQREEDSIPPLDGARYHWIDRRGNLVHEFDPEYQSPKTARIGELEKVKIIDAFDSFGLRPVRQGYWGWVDREGNVAIPFIYHQARDFDSAGMAAVTTGTLWHWIDVSGNVVIEPGWDEVKEFDSEGMAIVGKGGKYGWINRSGENVIPCKWEWVMPFGLHDLAAVWENGNIGWINRSGEMVIEPTWDHTFGFDADGLAAVSKLGSWGWIDLSGNVVIAPRWRNVDPAAQIFVNPHQPDPMTKVPSIAMAPAPVHDPTKPFRYFDEDGMAKVWEEGSRGAGWIDSKGRVLIEPQWDWATSFELNGLARASKLNAGDYKLTNWINRTGEVSFSFRGRASAFDSKGMAVVNDGGLEWDFQSLIVNSQGGIIKVVPGKCWVFDEHDRARVTRGSHPESRLGWIDRKGEMYPKDNSVFEHLEFVDTGSDVSGYYGIKVRVTKPNWGARIIDTAKDWLGLGKAEREFEEVYHCYDADGNLVWSSGWVLFETKCLVTLAICCLAALVSRPGRRRQKAVKDLEPE